MLKAMWNDENGAIVSIEMIVIITVAVLALIVGWAEVAAAVNTELDDISNAVGHLDQSYFFAGYAANKIGGANGSKSFYNASSWIDAADDCDDCDGVSNIVCAAGTAPQATGG